MDVKFNIPDENGIQESSSMSDMELVGRALSGEEASYGVLFDRYRSPVRVMLQCRIGNACDDVLQEAFIKAYMNLDKYNPLYTFPGWLYTIARNLSIDYMRRSAVTADSWIGFDGMETPLASSAPNPEEQVIMSQNRLKMENALERLSASYREIMYLRFWCDLSYEDISNRLSIPLGTVKTQIHRARQAFIALL